ncbi:alpha-1,4-glucan--maltose-1-phosphate maltosyltransferase [Luteimicrobium subarcticum]|uniref:Alpha-1,4-glucan:maltose-1-phosphate maltosyltransferase n=1 Tax=Luteimicrobium subarcticum TaxID=620910 RepID=A0A2M8W1G1_9MICO|nr:alpha-1,4-glucan:maltose-1-phosphate maltosyltransferase [Luteimicrobium subarcticum]
MEQAAPVPEPDAPSVPAVRRAPRRVAAATEPGPAVQSTSAAPPTPAASAPASAPAPTTPAPTSPAVRATAPVEDAERATSSSHTTGPGFPATTTWTGAPGIGRIPVVDVAPTIAEGRWPAKAAVGELVPVDATVFREGHDAVSATAVLVAPDGTDRFRSTMTDIEPGLDHFRGYVSPDEPGTWGLRVEGWSDPYATWRHDAEIKIGAGIDVQLMLDEGSRVLDRAVEVPGHAPADEEVLRAAAAALGNRALPPQVRLAAATSDEVAAALTRNPLRDLVSPSPTYPLVVDRQLALAGSWYELFPRSEGARRAADGTWASGTFATAAERLPAVAAMGFDVVYLTPIHPIGTTFRKGRNNSLTPVEGDPGSPYAIGAPEGGHDAVHPDLGTMDDFRALVARARELDLEVALDLALQCSPDHPWVHEHPEWFTQRADGSIAYAENPPKKYQDIYPLNFDNDPEGIYAEVLRVVNVWIDAGVTAFRVDNPHTKPLPFWERLLGEVRRTHPEVLFLSEAFTKPAMMRTLAAVGFHQSYTYFTWRNTRDEIAEYLEEVSGPLGSVMRPSFWPTTHDILPPYLQHGGAAGFAVRAVLAATGSPTWGVYSGYELVENVPRPGVEEQIDNEKYEYRPRDWSRGDDLGISLLLGRLNEIRRDHPALRQLRNLTVHPTTNDQVLAFSRRVPPTSETGASTGTKADAVGDTVLVIINLDPHSVQESTVELDAAALGLHPEQIVDDPWDPVIEAHDELSGSTYRWGRHVYVRLEPDVRVAHVVHVRNA